MAEESNRYAALFQHTNDAIALVEFQGESPIIVEANPKFESLFAGDETSVTGYDLDEIVANGGRIMEAREITRKARNGEPIRREVTRDTVEGPQEFSWQIVPVNETNDDVDRAFAIYTDISDRIRRQEELEQQNERLNEFAGIVSHDLRNPLEVAQIRLDLARDEADNEHLEVVARALDRMEALISDVLTWAREGGEVGDVETLDLAEAVDRCWEAVDTSEASLEIEATHVLEADDSRLQQLIENLIRNSVEHGGRDVTITVGDLDNGFYLEDDGVGIPEEEREQVFEVGYSTRDAGTGFGLNIVREIAHAHGWEISVTSSTEGGARFEFTGVNIQT